MKLIGYLALKNRRRAANVIASCGRMLGTMPVYQETVAAIRDRTGRGTAESYIAAKRTGVTHMANALDWVAFSRRSSAGLRRDLKKVRCEQDLGFDPEEENASVVLAGVHSGSLPLAIGWFSERHFPGWPVVIIKTASGDADERLVADRLPRFGVDLTVLTLDAKGDYLKVLRRARSKTLIICMIDLPGCYGKARSATLFWRNAILAGGAIDLARTCKARLVLFASRSHANREDIGLSGPYDVMGQSPENLSDLQDRMDRWISDAVIEHPGQWHFWDRLDEYAVSAVA